MKKTITSLLFILLFVNITSAQRDLTILLVNDNDKSPLITDSLRHAITANGYSFTEHNATSGVVPGIDLLSAFDLVIWSTGNDGSTRFWDKTDPLNKKANANLLTYLNNGGMLWLEGIDVMYDAFAGAKDTFPVGSFVHDYLGVSIYAGQAHVEDKVVYDGLPMMVAVDGNGICNTDTVTWRWPTMWYADAMVPTENATPVYQMGPSNYDLANYYCAIYNEKGNAKILSFFIRADGYKTAALGAEVTGDVLHYFAAIRNLVESIEITTLETSFVINENNGTLQVSATVLPVSAKNRTVTYSIGIGSVAATITQAGLITASGLDSGNGIAYIIATAKDGSGIADTVAVTISNQVTTHAVTSIEITSATSFEITENNGTLQLGATVLPENANNKTVTWALGAGSVNATISANGLVTASGLNSGNGIAYVIAAANDGSGIADTAAVTISNQVSPQAVTSIEITSASSFEITENNGSLQLGAIVLPENANNKTVTWTLGAGSVAATITQNGLITASGLNSGNGIAYVIAAANDGSGIADTAAVTISNQVSAQKDLTILLVNDNDKAPLSTDSLRHSITANGYTFTDYDAAVNGVPGVDYLSAYELVIWSTGSDGTTKFWDKTDSLNIKANANLLTYLDNGGMLWLEGIDVMYDAFAGAKDTFPAGSFVHDYLGVSIYAGQAHVDDKVVYDGLPMMVAVDGNGICNTDTVTWRWATMWYADAMVPTENAIPVYQMGPSDYDLANYYCAIYNEKNDAKILSFFIRADGYKTAALGAEVTGDVLDYFNQFATGGSVEVSTIEITSATGFEITESNGTLQLEVTVLPEDATNKTVTWALGAGSVNATISANGLVTASGLNSGNGIAYVIATANDGSGIADTAAVTISNQTIGEGYNILLVNDNGNGIDRYMEIDTALTAGGYNYRIYNSVTEGAPPTAAYLANFEFVIWYTGNDGVGLNFWDVSDSTNIKCNAALKQFADNGGVVWLQGLDFFYDIYGGKYDKLLGKNANGDSIIAEFANGNFVYDYLGIKEYVAQSHVNETSGNYVGVEQLDITEENEITTLDPIKWLYAEMWYVDAVDVTENAIPLYYLGPETYDFSLYYAMVYNKKGNAQFITSTFETARLDNQEHTNQLFKEVIDYVIENTDIHETNPVSDQLQLMVYPNPASNMFTARINTSTVEKLNVQITDIAGKLVYQESLYSTLGEQTLTIDISNLSNGLYNITVKTDNLNTNQRLVIIK